MIALAGGWGGVVGSHTHAALDEFEAVTAGR